MKLFLIVLIQRIYVVWNMFVCPSLRLFLCHHLSVLSVRPTGWKLESTQCHFVFGSNCFDMSRLITQLDLSFLQVRCATNLMNFMIKRKMFIKMVYGFHIYLHIIGNTEQNISNNFFMPLNLSLIKYWIIYNINISSINNNNTFILQM